MRPARGVERDPAPVQRIPRQQTGTVTVLAIGRQGWAVAERRVDGGTPLVVEAVAEQLRGQVRADTGWMPAIIVLDACGDEVTARFRVE
jgi:L,D-peptidoglycan transpeptidase YkuD (ErfK/YbiS/YcfS/YnhG family)